LFFSNQQYVLENLLCVEIASKQDTTLLYFNASERCDASFQQRLVLLVPDYCSVRQNTRKLDFALTYLNNRTFNVLYEVQMHAGFNNVLVI